MIIDFFVSNFDEPLIPYLVTHFLAGILVGIIYINLKEYYEFR